MPDPRRPRRAAPAAVLAALAAGAAAAAFGWIDGGARGQPEGAPRAAAVAAPDAVAGRARVVDGDTLEVAGRKVRLLGVDAPEMDQRCADADGRRYACGERARDALEALTRGRDVTCEGPGEDPYGRLVAACRADGRDLGAALTRAGWTLAFRRFSDAYVAEEEAARAARAGLWAGAFAPPWDHRAGDYRAVGAAARANPDLAAKVAPRGAVPPDGDCAIKGNVSDSGRIYHVPSDRSYAATRISVDRGERWFCSEAEAEAAGWRPVRR